jgi:hypothetical protein
MKVLVGGSDDRILGFTMTGAEAGEVMAAVQTAMLAALPYPVLRDAVLGPPSLVEPAQHFFDCVRGAAAGLDQPGYFGGVRRRLTDFTKTPVRRMGRILSRIF